MATKVVSYSEIDAYRQCRLKHQLSYLERWQSDTTAPALSRGTLFHSVMEAHYGKLRQLRSEFPDEERAEWAEDLFLAVAPLLHEEGTGAQTDEQELVQWIYQGYVDLYGTDEDWEIVGIEVPLEEWLPNENGNRTSFKLAGTVDLIVRDGSAGGGLWIVDHKTCKNLPKDLELDLDDQAALYMYLLRRHGMNIRGHIRNAIRSERLKTREMDWRERFARPITARLDAELETIALEAYRTMKEAYKPLHGQDRPRSPDTDLCRWKCNFTAACLAGRKGYDWRQFLEDAGFEQRAVKPGPTFDPASQAKTYGIPQ